MSLTMEILDRLERIISHSEAAERYARRMIELIDKQNALIERLFPQPRPADDTEPNQVVDEGTDGSTK